MPRHVVDLYAVYSPGREKYYSWLHRTWVEGLCPGCLMSQEDAHRIAQGHGECEVLWYQASRIATQYFDKYGPAENPRLKVV